MTETVMISALSLLRIMTMVTASSNAVSNLLGFYMSYRRLCFCRCGISQDHLNELNSYDFIEEERYSPLAMPWLAIVYTGNSTFKGALISDRHIITAGSPLHGLPASHIKVKLGVKEHCTENHALSSGVEAIFIHPGYSDTVRENDIALLRLRHMIKFNKWIVPICMPLYDIDEAEHLAWTLRDFQQCLIQVTPLQISTSKFCLSRAKTCNASITPADRGCIRPLASSSSLCEGDIGAPVVTQWMKGSPFRLAGIVSSVSCGQDVISIFTKTVEHLPWIYENIRNDCQCF